MNNGTHVVLIDNHDSFVYNLVDVFAVGGYRCTVFRNTVSVEQVLQAEPDLICLSPGPGHPREAGNMMDIIEACIGTIPIIGICLGFQALLEHFGASVGPCGPVHGVTDSMELSQAGLQSPIFQGLTTDAGPENNFSGRLVPVARYHSLGCRVEDAPAGIVSLASARAEIGSVIMAAITDDHSAIGLQFHPESVLSPTGPIIVDRCITQLLHRT
ncbi:anthranilate synthase component II [Corynebacterium felinum]|uniref:anthranilate synthase n=1 Tax=Corynebacterium felinum TaxID=131318 RepID=A0ABU2B8B0_9CORY|nr:anthranilate synthase component II [Corynebacterium felinum]MDF5819615.1 anthranilate synthase component II [Corynebacterium felinum]MDR7354254.1 anthranilate synthase component 2 [Corynebacterium felinum]WJY96422.1 Anthranilate synthase component 2 [Corynebacterium felinum]